ncbi:response regulator [Saccharibacillus qingshengii]|uniref:response regulator n=1 Tax=Saccharibacillus qingshengii TaxID=1763540 RepID=UPI0015543521|nr:response regulator [Saccharibacillus qingshengii]
MNKYQKLFTQQAAENLDRMLNPDARTDERTVYRMLHSIKGTSGTIGLQQWYEVSLRLMNDFREEGDRVFTGEELSERLEMLRRLLEVPGRGDWPSESGAGLYPAPASGNSGPDGPPSDGHNLRRALSNLTGSPDAEAGAVPVESAPQVPRREQPEFTEEFEEKAESEGTVLLLDDDLGLLALLKDILESRGFTVFATPRFDKAVEWFYEMRPDCAVLDVLLPEQNGFELMGRLRELCDRYMIPVVLMTAKSDDATRLKAYEEGADDFLTKPMNPDEFVVRIRRLIRHRRRVTAQLMLDQTTGAYGMPFLESELTRRIGLLGELNEPLALAAVELDGLRRLNERTGYREGDRLLKDFSDAVRRLLKPRDIWARDRAGRFYLLQPGMNADQSGEFLERILLDEEIGAMTREVDVTALHGVVEAQEGFTRQRALSGAVRALEAAAGRERAQKSGGAASEGPEASQLRLALIDDDPLMRTILEQQLQSLEEEYELEIRSFADGEEFLSDPWHAGGSRYLLILDRMMPRMNGMEVLARLRSGEYEPIYTVLMLTGVGDERGIAEAIRAGTDDYMTKPFSMVELEARVRRLLGKVGAFQ